MIYNADDSDWQQHSICYEENLVKGINLKSVKILFASCFLDQIVLF